MQKISRNNLPWAIPTINLPFRRSVISTCAKGAMWRRMCSLGLWAQKASWKRCLWDGHNGERPVSEKEMRMMIWNYVVDVSFCKRMVIFWFLPMSWECVERLPSFPNRSKSWGRFGCFYFYFLTFWFFFGFLPTPCVMGLHIYIIYEYLWCSMIKMINWQILITCYRMTLWSELVVYCALWSAAHLSVTVALGCVGPRSWVPETACPFLTLRWVAAGQQTLGVEQTKPLSRVEKVHMQQMNAEDILMHCKRDQNLEAVAVWIRLNCFGDKSTEL